MHYNPRFGDIVNRMYWYPFNQIGGAKIKHSFYRGLTGPVLFDFIHVYVHLHLIIAFLVLTFSSSTQGDYLVQLLRDIR